jgi:hypothetical protein
MPALPPVVPLDLLADGVEERRRVGAVEGPVVEREREVADRPHDEGVTTAPVGARRRAGADAVHREDADLRVVDDRERRQRVAAADVGDRERAALDVVRLQVLGAGPLREIGDRGGERPETQRVGVVHHRHDETGEVEVDGDAEVDVVVVPQPTVDDRCVDVGEGPQGVDHGPGHEREVREAGRLAGPVDEAEVDLLDQQRVHRCLHRLPEVCPRPGPDGVERRDPHIPSRTGDGSSDFLRRFVARSGTGHRLVGDDRGGSAGEAALDVGTGGSAALPVDHRATCHGPLRGSLSSVWRNSYPGARHSRGERDKLCR